MANIWPAPESVPCSLVKDEYLAVVGWLCSVSLYHVKLTVEPFS